MKHKCYSNPPPHFQTSVIVGGISALGVEKTRIVKNQMCPIISSTSQWYSTYHFSAIVLIYAVSFVCLLIIKYRTRVSYFLLDSKSRTY